MDSLTVECQKKRIEKFIRQQHSTSSQIFDAICWRFFEEDHIQLLAHLYRKCEKQVNAAAGNNPKFHRERERHSVFSWISSLCPKGLNNDSNESNEPSTMTDLIRSYIWLRLKSWNWMRTQKKIIESEQFVAAIEELKKRRHRTWMVNRMESFSLSPVSFELKVGVSKSRVKKKVVTCK